MVFFKWTKDLETSIPLVDREHQKLVELLNKLYNAMKRGEGTEVVGEIIGSLKRYTQTHFKNEEKLFEKLGYPKIDEHIKIHNNFVAKIVEFEREFNSGSVALSIDIMNFLRSWLKDHIAGDDQAYARYFKDKGLI